LSLSHLVIPLFDSFEGGFSILNSKSQSGQEIFSPMMKFPVENINKIYNKVTKYRINIEMKGKPSGF